MENKVIKILAIDDYPDNLIILKALIQEAFKAVVILTATNGKEGIDLARREDPDVILLDVVMPEMDGFEVCKRLKTEVMIQDIPVVFLTAIKGDKKHRIRALEVGAEAFLAKPVDAYELTAQINAMVKIKESVVERRSQNEILAKMVEEKTLELKQAYEKTKELLDALRIENEAKKKNEVALIESQKLAHIGSYEYDAISKRLYCTDETLNIFGTTRQEFRETKEFFYSKIHPDDLQNMIESNLKARTYKHSVEYIYRIVRRDKSIVVAQVRYMPVFDKQGIHIRSVGTIQDITERSKTEDELLYLSRYDNLTGLYNRRYYEVELKRLDHEKNLPLSIIIADINGLKLINDSFGNNEGDDMLKKAARIITKGCRSVDMVARFGGDEFIILLLKTESHVAEEIISRIKEQVLIQGDGMDISMSFGYGTKNFSHENFQDIYKIAEDQMYKNKLYESSSARSKTIELIMNTLFAKSNREMMHSRRVSKICELTAVEMHMDQEAIKQVKTAGLMHDIGKMGVDEKVLNKPGKLNNNEWHEIKKHPEIGYRILSSVNEFSEISKYILEHHEKWDGSGYPRGLKGEEISIQSRIIGIADAYDAMTSNRSYRIGLCKAEAIDEILRYAGTQFDPLIANVFIEHCVPLL